jgi:hypothetical protein
MGGVCMGGTWLENLAVEKLGEKLGWINSVLRLGPF